MLRTVFVRSIPRSYDEAAFQELFKDQEGMLKSFLIQNSTGHKGIGFVEFNTSKHAQRAINNLNGSKIGDRELKLEFAKEREAFHERKKRKIQSRQNDDTDEKAFFESLGPHSRLRTIAIGGVNSEQVQIVHTKAEGIGKVQSVVFPASPRIIQSAHLEEDGCPSGVILLTFQEVSAAAKAVYILHRMKLPDSKDRKLWCRQISGEGAQVKKNKIIIRNLPFEVNEEQVKLLLSRVGFVWKLDIPRDSNGMSRGFGFAYYTTHNHAKIAVENLNGQRLSGRAISVEWAMSKTQYKQTNPHLDETADQKVQNLLMSFIPDSNSQESEDLESIHEQEVSETKPKQKTKHEQSSNSIMNGQDRADALNRTLFVSGLALDVTEESLASYMSQFGPLSSIKIVTNKLTGKSKGTAFVEYSTLADKDRALESISNNDKSVPSIFGLDFSVKQALSRDAVNTVVTKRKQEKQKSDRRNLYLLQEGRIEENSELWNSLSKTDQEIRKRSIKLKREKLKNPLFYVSKTRLCIRNLPSWITESKLEALMVNSIKSRAKSSNPRVRQVKLLYDDSSKGKSLRRGFVELDLHEHALCALRVLNANPEIFSPQRRPIVEFAIDNREITNKRDQLISKLKFEARESGQEITDISFGFGKKKRKGRNERLKEKKSQSQNLIPTLKRTRKQSTKISRKLTSTKIPVRLNQNTRSSKLKKQKQDHFENLLSEHASLSKLQ